MLLLSVVSFPCSINGLQLCNPFIHSLVEELYLQLLAISGKVSMNIYVQVLVGTSVFIWLGCIARRGIAGSCVNSVFNHLRNHWIISKSAVPFYLPPAGYE